MSNAESSGSRPRSRRREGRRSRKRRGARSPALAESTASKGAVQQEAKELPLKKVFIYTYTIRKIG